MYNENDYQTSNPKEALARQLAKLLGDTVNFTFLAQGAHWNVKGSDFYQMHEFFGLIYEDAQESIDPMAENILKLGYDAPYTLTDFKMFSSIEPRRVTTGQKLEFVAALHEANAELLHCLNNGFELAEKANEQGVADFLAGRIDMQQKWQWQLSATLGTSVNVGVTQDVAEEGSYIIEETPEY
jgi:starvation-inducible DNA-binding protein